MSRINREDPPAYWPGDLVRHGTHTSHVLIISAPIVPDVFLGVGVIPAKAEPTTATYPFYIPVVDGFAIATLVRAYNGFELGEVVAHTGEDALATTRLVLISALGGTP